MHSIASLSRPFALFLMGLPVAAQATALSYKGDSVGATFGSTVELIGDVNADGLLDVAVGAPYADATIFLGFPVFINEAGRVSVYSGADGSLLWSVVGPLGGGSEFGFAIEDANDVDGDGAEDVLIGAPKGDGLVSESGVVQLFSGATGAFLRSFPGSQTGERYGEALAVGELDVDWTSGEAAIGAPSHDLDDDTGAFLEEGRVEIVDLVSGLPERNFPGTPYYVGDIFAQIDEFERKRWGAQIEYIGDPDVDSYGSIVVSAPLSNKYDKQIFSPEPVYQWKTGFLRSFEPFDPLTFLTDAGWSAGGVGDGYGSVLTRFRDDLNNDDKWDWATYAVGEGEVRVYSGDTYQWSMSGGGVAGLTALDEIGDWDQDGVADIGIGIPGAITDSGQVYVRSGQTGAQLEWLTGPNVGDRYGSGLAFTDLNSDGRPEAWVGARRDDTAMEDAGAVYVENDHICLGTASWSASGPGTPGLLGSPILSSNADPVLGTIFPIFITSSSDENQVAALVIGVEAITLPILGGHLTVSPILIESFQLPAAGMIHPLHLPENPSLCGVQILIQLVQADPFAPQGWSFSNMIAARMGSNS